MKIIECSQGSDLWFQARSGIPTASNFGMIITPTGKKSGQMDKYILKCVAEWLSGGPIEDGYKNRYMELGIEREAEAREQYSFVSGNEVEQVGFCLADDGSYGYSPDGLISDNGLIEIKSPAATTIIEYYSSGFPGVYKPQVQTGLKLTEREFCDFYAYYPTLMPFVVRINRDEEYIKKIGEYLSEFTELLEQKKEELKAWKV